jgi:hypothetical protein
MQNLLMLLQVLWIYLPEGRKSSLENTKLLEYKENGT